MDNKHADLLVEAICSLRCELSEGREQAKAQFDWFRAHIELPTKCDLKAMEDRIISSIGKISDDDKCILGGLLKRSELITKKLEQLDSITPHHA